MRKIQNLKPIKQLRDNFLDLQKISKPNLSINRKTNITFI